MRQVTVDARDKDNRAERFKVVTTILDASIDGGQIGDLYERRWSGEVDIRSIKSTMQMDVLRCKTPEMVAQGDLGPPAGVQPAPDGDGRGGGRGRDRAAAGELQGGQAGGDGVRAEDRGGAAGGSAGADRCAAGGDRLPPRRRPPGAVGAAGTEAAAEAGGPPARNHEPRPSCRRIARNGSKASAIRRCDRKRQGH